MSMDNEEEFDKLRLTEWIIRYEEGTISEENYYRLFQALVDTGMAWELQGSYGRQAALMIEEGILLPPERLNRSESKLEPIVAKPKKRGGRKSQKQVGALVRMPRRNVEGLGIIISRMEDVTWSKMSMLERNIVLENMRNKGEVGWGVLDSDSHKNFVLVKWFSAPSDYTTHATRTEKQWYPDKWVSVVSPVVKLPKVY